VTEAYVIDRLEAVSAVTMLVGDRLYALKAPQQPTTPYIRVQRISTPHDQHLRGPDYPARYRFQVDCCSAETSGDDPLGTAQELAMAVIGDGLGPTASGLFGWSGLLEDGPLMITVHNVELFHAGDLEHFPEEMRLDRVRTDFLFHWSPLG
jgi:hypothetical protein